MSATESHPALVVRSEDVVDAGVFVRATADAQSGGVRRVDGDIESLLATWHGVAADAYQAGWDDFRRGANEVLGALARIGKLLDHAGVTYADTDDVNARTLRSLEL